MAAKRRSQGTRSQPRPQAALERAPEATPALVVEAGASSVTVGRMLAGSSATAPLVDFPGNTKGPLRGRAAVALDAPAIHRAVATGQGVVLVFENGDRRLPIVMGLISTGQAPTPFQELLVSARPTNDSRTDGARLEARLDGERVVLEGKREVVLKCGEASITLRSDGKMVLRGAYIETYAKGVNRIKGASVKIN